MRFRVNGPAAGHARPPAAPGYHRGPCREPPWTSPTLQDDWVNPRDPARALGPDGRPARSRRAPFYADVPDEQWDDWRWQLSNRVNDLETFARILELTDEEREGLGAPDKFRVDITPYFISLVDPADPDDPIRRQVMPLGREQEAFTAMMEDSLAEDRHSPVPGLVHRYPDRVLMLVTTQCASYCRYCTRSRIVGDADPELQHAATSRRSSTTCGARPRCATCCSPAATR